MSRIYSAKEAAEILGVSQRQITMWCNEGAFGPEAYRLNWRSPLSHWRITQRGIDAFLEQRGRQAGGALYNE
jgi:predicted site-specific integrase-resolvase